jgi:hypothetical protein
MKTYVILLNASEDMMEGASWFKRTAKTAEDAVAQLAADLGRDAGWDEAEAIEIIGGSVIVRKEMRWEAHHTEGGGA